VTGQDLGFRVPLELHFGEWPREGFHRCGECHGGKI
jgi:hypothetical protein